MSDIRTLLPETRELVSSLNMTDAVLFGDWLPYGNYSGHPLFQRETRYSFLLRGKE